MKTDPQTPSWPSERFRAYNATRHDQWSYAAEWDALGVSFVPTMGPGVNGVPPDASVDEIQREIDEVLAKAVASCADSILIGGRYSIAAAIAAKAATLGLHVIEPVFSGRNNDGTPRLHKVLDVTDLIERATRS